MVLPSSLQKVELKKTGKGLAHMVRSYQEYCKSEVLPTYMLLPESLEGCSLCQAMFRRPKQIWHRLAQVQHSMDYS